MERPTLMPHDRFGRRALIAITRCRVGGWNACRARPMRPQFGIGYMRWTEPQQTISLLDKPPPDDGLAGAKLAMSDNNTTGQFMGQQFELDGCAGACR